MEMVLKWDSFLQYFDFTFLLHNHQNSYLQSFSGLKWLSTFLAAF